MKLSRWLISHLLISTLGLGAAFLVSLKFVSKAHSQQQETVKVEAQNAANLQNQNSNSKTNPEKGSSNAQAIPSTPDPNLTPVNINKGLNEDKELGSATQATNSSSSFIKPQEEYVYDPTGRRDPFIPYKTIRKAPIVATKTNKVINIDELDPLQKWDLDKYRVIGILWETQNPRAMIADPDGHIFTIQKNVKIGRASGVVKAIREGEIVVVEVVDVDGTDTQQIKVLELGKK